MKKSFLFFALVITSLLSRAGVAELFTFDNDAIHLEMADLNALEAYVQTNEGVTYDEVFVTNSLLVENVLKTEQNPYSFASAMHMGQGPLGVSSFTWGLCLGFVGILVVYMIADNSDETSLALYGCIANGAITAVIFFVYRWAFIAGTTI